jgi:hypothetical protein
MTGGRPVVEPLAFRMLLRSVHPSAFSSPVWGYFDSGRRNPVNTEPDQILKRCIDWKNDISAHNNHRKQRNTPTDVCLLKYREMEIDIRGIESCISICARLGRPIITNATSEDNVHWII